MRLWWLGAGGYPGPATNATRVPTLPGLIDTESADAVGTQLGISDRPAFLSHTGVAEASTDAEEMIVPLALPHVLCRRLLPFPVWVRFCRSRGLRLYGLTLFHELMSVERAGIGLGLLADQIAVEASWSEIGTVARRLIDREFIGKAALHIL